MSQTDLSLANQSRTAFRAELNAHLAALASQSLGPVAPTVTFGGMLWLDSGVAPPVLRQRDAANTAWTRVLLDYATSGDMSAGTAFKVADAAQVKAYLDGILATLDVSASIAGQAYGAVGTYVYAGRSSIGTIVPGALYAGSGLVPAGFASTNGFTDNTAQDISYGATLSGTWMACGATASGGARLNGTLFKRI
jgi:hypothetical protein